MSQPVNQRNTSRGLLKYILLSIITCGIYSLWFWSTVGEDVNLVCSRYDGKKSMHYLLMLLIVSPLTCGIGLLVWIHKICNRIGVELYRRRIPYSFGASDFWLWSVLGSLIVIGPFVYLHRLCAAMNLLNADYNVNG